MKTREQLEATGNKILNSVRTELYLSMRFMGPALGSLGFAIDLSTRTVGTDAVYIRFNPTYLLQTYIERPEILNRTYMHTVSYTHLWIILLCYGNSILPPWKFESVTMSSVRIIFCQNGIANI